LHNLYLKGRLQPIHILQLLENGCWLSIIGAVVIAAGVALYALEEKKNA